MLVSKKAAGARPRVTLCAFAGLLASCQTAPEMWARSEVPASASDAAIDARARAIVAGMTLEQKVGQMTQADIRSVTPDDARRHYLGAVENGGGASAALNTHGSPYGWLESNAAFFPASFA